MPRDNLAGLGLRTALESAQFTVLQATPSTWQTLLQAGWEGDPALTALSGGEALTEDLASDLLPRVRQLWNLYGPTEATVWVTATEITKPKRIGIGMPIGDTEIRVVDQNLRVVPENIPGELCIAGKQLALGYVGEPELNSAKFFLDEDGDRFYRTGDRVVLHADGVLRFIDRLDNQVKIRGFRIELSEIEDEINAISGISRSFVKAHKVSKNDTRLIAYYVPVAGAVGQEIEQVEVRRQLNRVLPYYMVPQHLIRLDSLPQRTSGKIDLDALPSIESLGLSLVNQQEKPKTPQELFLAKLWKEVLNVPAVGRHDNFFQLGGHSMLALQVISSVHRELDS